MALWRRFVVKMTAPGGGPLGRVLPEVRLAGLQRAAQGGDAAVQAQLWLLHQLAGDDVPLDAASEARYLPPAAVAGQPLALARVAQLLDDARCDALGAVPALRAAPALAAEPRVALQRAVRRMRGADPAQGEAVRALLRRATDSSEPALAALAAGLLATHPVTAYRDPVAALERALALASLNDPDVLEAQAAAQAASGHFSEAVAAGEAALAAARRLHWNTARIEERLARYRAGEAWTGLLCDCSEPAP
jgi:hypothetical protein